MTHSRPLSYRRTAIAGFEAFRVDGTPADCVAVGFSRYCAVYYQTLACRWSTSIRHYDGQVVPIKDPMGRQLYWFTVVPMEGTEEGTDRWAIERGLISVTPLRLDLTDQDALERMRNDQPNGQKT